MDLLVLLVSHHGRLVTREEIVERLWSGKVVIDFDTGLNTLVSRCGMPCMTRPTRRSASKPFPARVTGLSHLSRSLQLTGSRSPPRSAAGGGPSWRHSRW